MTPLLLLCSLLLLRCLCARSVEGTLAKHILTEPEYIQSMNGGKIPLHMSVTYISFSAHADYTETSEFIDLIRPPHIILVHGDASEGVGRLRYALESRYKDGSIKVVAPRNAQTIQLQFRAQKVAKTVGSMALVPPSSGQHLSGLLVRKNFTDYTLMKPEELSEFTTLAATTVEQSLKIPFHQTFECMRYFVAAMYEIEGEEQEGGQATASNGAAAAATKDGVSDMEVEGATKAGSSSSNAAAQEKKEDFDGSITTPGAAAAASAATSDSIPTLTIHRSVRLLYHTTPTLHVELRWKSNPVNDMISDSLIAILTNIQSNPGMARVIGAAGGCRNAKAVGHTTKQTAEDSEHVHGAGCSHDHSNEPKLKDVPAFSGSSADASYFASVLKPALPSASRGPSFRWFLEQHYGRDIDFDADRRTYSFTLNTVPCVVHERTLEVDCGDSELRARIRAMVRRAHAACNPIQAINSAPTMDKEEEKLETKPAQPTASAQAAAPTSS